MKKMTLLSLGIITFSALALGAPAAFAADEIIEAKAESEATVLFEADDTETKPPVDPPITGGGEEGEVDEKETDGNSGDGTASFNLFVSNFRFNDRADDDGENGVEKFTKFKPIKLNGNGMTLWAKGTQLGIKEKDKTTTTIYKDIPNFVQVVDNRGKTSGWKLSVTASEFSGENEAGDIVTLKGANLSVNNLNLKGPDGVTPPMVNELNGVISTTSNILMTADQSTNPEARQGTGTWSLKFGEEETVNGNSYGTLKQDTGVKLEIPAGAQPQAGVPYKSDLTWVLADGPTA